MFLTVENFYGERVEVTKAECGPWCMFTIGGLLLSGDRYYSNFRVTELPLKLNPFFDVEYPYL